VPSVSFDREFVAAGGLMSYGGSTLDRIGVLLNLPADDPQNPIRVTAFAQVLQQLGWTDGRNIKIEYRYDALGGARAGGQDAAASGRDTTNTAMLVTIMMCSTNMKPWFTMRSPKTSANKTVPTIIAHTFRLKDTEYSKRAPSPELVLAIEEARSRADRMAA
jgi:hypothetical protein